MTIKEQAGISLGSYTQGHRPVRVWRHKGVDTDVPQLQERHIPETYAGTGGTGSEDHLRQVPGTDENGLRAVDAKDVSGQGQPESVSLQACKGVVGEKHGADRGVLPAGYNPELNPDDRPNADLKHAITTSVPRRTQKGDLKKTKDT